MNTTLNKNPISSGTEIFIPQPRIIIKNPQKFKDLTIGWKTMVVIGGISIFIVVVLVVLLVLIFETDLIPIETLLGTTEDTDLSQYDDFFKSLDSSLDTSLDKLSELPELSELPRTDSEEKFPENSEDKLEENIKEKTYSNSRKELLEKIDQTSKILDRISEMNMIIDLDDGNFID